MTGGVWVWSRRSAAAASAAMSVVRPWRARMAAAMVRTGSLSSSLSMVPRAVAGAALRGRRGGERQPRDGNLHKMTPTRAAAVIEERPAAGRAEFAGAGQFPAVGSGDARGEIEAEGGFVP